MYCLQVLSQVFSTCGLHEVKLARLDDNMSKLVDALSACERILNTPIPLSYTR
jgi:predicted membrane chloride channel (bestrophin family)